VTDFERALEDESFSYQGLHYSEFIDVETFVDFMLINELARNVDGYRLSSYMYKDKNAKMKMGPVWDFNLAFGNADYCNGSVINGWEWDFNSICDNDFYVNHFWWKRFLEDPSYVDSLRTRWWELRENEYSFDNICGIIDSLQEHIGVAATRNFERWPVLGTYIWPNNFVGNTYIEEVDYLKGWIKDRLEFIDDNIDELSMITSEIRDFNIWPNPTQGEITIGIGRYTPEDLTTVIFDNAGRVVKEIPMLHYSGEVLDLGLSSGLYFYALKNEKDLVSDVYKLIIVN